MKSKFSFLRIGHTIKVSLANCLVQIFPEQSIVFFVCKTVHHHTFNRINQPDAATCQVYYLSFKYSSTCFRHPYAHHQELQQMQ
jgi:hypothetical protein